MWSLGTIILEIAIGFPVWLPYKGRMKTGKGRNVVEFGIFGSTGRDCRKIMLKQKQVI